MDRSYCYSRRLVSRARLRRRMAAVSAAGLAGAAALFMFTWEAGPMSGALPSVAVLAAKPAPPAAGEVPASAEPERALRRIYPYSVVPGGVADKAELAHVVRTDRVVAAHYAGFDVGKARPVVVDKPRAVYVSYRKGDQIYWTAHKVMLAEGETLLSDGRNDMRARCANRISDVPQYPVETHQPRMEELDNPVEVAEDLLPLSMSGEDGIPGHAGVTYPIQGGAGGERPDNTPADGVPVSSTPGITGAAPLTTTILSAFSGSVGKPREPVATPPSSSGTDTPADGTRIPSNEAAETMPAPDTWPDLPLTPSPPVVGAPGLDSGNPPSLPPENTIRLPVTKSELIPAQPHKSTEIPRPPTDVPEPASIWLFGALLPVVFALRRRTRS